MKTTAPATAQPSYVMVSFAEGIWCADLLWGLGADEDIVASVEFDAKPKTSVVFAALGLERAEWTEDPIVSWSGSGFERDSAE